jgi:hypothetical protein
MHRQRFGNHLPATRGEKEAIRPAIVGRRLSHY